jgi:hypothetical protein
MTETELKVMAALAMTWLKSKPKIGIERAGRDRNSKHL